MWSCTTTPYHLTSTRWLAYYSSSLPCVCMCIYCHIVLSISKPADHSPSSITLSLSVVHFQAELEGSPEILLTLSTPSDLPPLDPHLVVHPGVQVASASSQLDTSATNQQMRHRKIRFSAPAEQFTLCHYRMSGLPQLPVRGFYQMKVLKESAKD